jgi:hypothetical protein
MDSGNREEYMRIFIFMMIVVIFTGVSHRYQRDSHHHNAKESVIRAVPETNIAFEHRVELRSGDSRIHRLFWYTRDERPHEHYFI